MTLSRSLVCLVFSTLLLTSSYALIGNNLLGKKYCVVGCGRGPLGIAPLGDVIRGVNEAAFGPSFDELEARGKTVADYAATRLEAVVKDANKSAEQLLNELSEVSQDGVVQLDKVLAANISLMMEGLSQQLGALDLIGTKKIDELNLVVRTLVILITLASLLVWIGKSVDSAALARRGEWSAAIRSSRTRLLASVAVLVFLVPVTFYFTQSRLAPIISSLEQDYSKLMRRLDFRRAAVIAANLNQTYPDRVQYERWRDKSQLLSDVFFNPASYRTYEGLTRISVGLDKLLRNPTATTKDRVPKIAEDSDNSDGPLTIEHDAELEAAFATITWQLHQDDVHRLRVASIAAHILNRPPTDASPLRLIAAHHLRTYMLNPIRDWEWSALVETYGSNEKYSLFDVYPRLTEAGGESLLRTLDSGDAAPTDSSEQKRLKDYVRFGRAFSERYSLAISSYVQMLDAHFSAASAPADKKAGLIERRNQLAARVKSTWEEMASAEFSDGFRADFNLRMTMLGAVHSTYSRSQEYLKADGSGGVPAALEKKDISPERTFHRRWVTTLNTQVRPITLKYLEFRLDQQFLADTKLLLDFETKYQLFSKGRALGAARDAAGAASALGLFVCVGRPVATTKFEDAVLTAVDCAEKNSLSVRAMWFIRGQLPETDRRNLQSWKPEFERAISRPIPIS